MSRIVNHTMTKTVLPHDVSHHKSARRAIYVRLSGRQEHRDYRPLSVSDPCVLSTLLAVIRSVLRASRSR